MSQHKQTDLLKKIEQERGSRLIVYVTSDRPPPFQAKMALDVVRPFYDHLKRIGHTQQIDLFVFSQGGDTIVPWRIVNLAREFCERFSVLVPYKAHSAATLLALGADEIVMGALGELSPIDPSVSTPFNPPHPDNPNEPKTEISVEDVTGFINLAKDRVGITDQDNLIRVFEKLADRIHPLAIGGVYRTHALIRALAAKMLALHMKQKAEAQRIPKIVDDLAEKLYYHNYLINRIEAEDLGLKVVKPTDALEKVMWDLYLAYEAEMELGKLFDPMAFAQAGAANESTVPLAVIESVGLRSQICKRIKATPITIPPQQGLPPGPQIAIQEQVIGWMTEEIKGE
jgi:hypothetical protein